MTDNGEIIAQPVIQLRELGLAAAGAAAAANAVPDAWFTPLAPGWGAVEKQKIIPDMLTAILKGKSVDQATKDADTAIDQLINNPS